MSQRSIKEGNTNFHEGFSSSRNKIEALSASNWVPHSQCPNSCLVGVGASSLFVVVETHFIFK